MGEIADAMINGDMDFYTGEYIGRGKGIPRTLDRSLPWEKGKNYKQNKEAAYKGVRNFLKNRFGITDITPAVNKYLPEPGKSLKQKCFAIQQDFGAFVSWASRSYDNKCYAKIKVVKNSP